MKHGVPYNRAFSMSPTLRLAHLIAMGELDGGSWDDAAKRWRERS